MRLRRYHANKLSLIFTHVILKILMPMVIVVGCKQFARLRDKVGL